MATLNDFSQLNAFKPRPVPQKPAPKPPSTPQERALAAAESSADFFSSLLGPAKDKPSAPSPNRPAAPAPSKRITVVTPGNMDRVRAQQASAAFDLEREALQKEIANLKLDYGELSEEKTALEEQYASLNENFSKLQEVCAKFESVLATMNERLSEANAALDAERAAPRTDPNVAAELDRTRSDLSAAQSALAQSQSALAAANSENERLAAALAEAQRTSLSSSVLLDKPDGISEKFPGEIREHVLETIKTASDAADAAGRLRRARILEAVSLANSANGELESRRNALKQIFRDTGGRIDSSAIARFQKLGFRYIDGKNHHKLEWAGIRITMPKTPSDYRTQSNSANDIANQLF